jgi:circadian clock protein KaiC
MREQQVSPLARMPTGIPGFDEITRGGLPRQGVTVVLGNAGAGKTVFGTQVLATGVRSGQPGIMVAFEESAAQIMANTSAFSWGTDLAAEGAVSVLDACLSQTVEEGGQFDLIGLLALVAARARSSGAHCVVFDGLDILLDYLGDTALIRREIFRLREWVSDTGLAAIVTAKSGFEKEELALDYGILPFIADCVVTMHHRVLQGTAVRFIRVAKYRGAAHSANEFPLVITAAGLEVAAGPAADPSYPASSERVSTGVERLDGMLSGGYHRGSSILITGVPGTAKTTLAVAFARAAAMRGEKTVFISFDETPDQIVRNVASVGLDLQPHLDSGMLQLRSFRGGVESPEAQVARIRTLLRQVQPRHLVMDPLSSLSRPALEQDMDGAAIRLIEICKSAGITLMSTSLLGNGDPLLEKSPLNVSALADTWMHVTYIDQGGERNRALTIIKARGTGHSNQIRELVLSDSEVTLADVYAVGGKVLMGTQRWEKETEVRHARAAAKSAAMLRQQKVELTLAETTARLRTLAQEQKLQEAELQQIKADFALAADDRSGEDDELLLRRHADQ